MMFLVEKTAALLIAPLGFALLVGLFALLLAKTGWRRTGSWFGGLALIWLYAWSTPFASEWVVATLERQYPPVQIAKLPSAPVAVVLGGGIAAPKLPYRLMPDLGDSADRVWLAARLYYAGKAKNLMLSGGVDARLGGLSEAQSMALFLADLSVPAAALFLEEGSLNTRQNAALVATRLRQRGVNRILLVTSAAHMPRAIGHFQKQGLEVIAAATDYRAVDSSWDIRKLLPSAGALENSGMAFKEWVGLWAGR